MNKSTLLACALLGILFGWGLKEKLPHTLSEHLSSETSLYLIPNANNELLININSEMELKSNLSFDFFLITDKKVGYSSSGNYEFDGKRLSLRSTAHEEVLPDRHLELYENMLVRNRSGLSSEDNLIVVPTENGSYLIFSTRTAYYYTPVSI